MNGAELTLLLPCYNEAENIPVVLPELIAFAKNNYFRIIIVNDGSVDNSSEELDKFSDLSIITIVTHKLNRGYGAALKSGLIPG